MADVEVFSGVSLGGWFEERCSDIDCSKDDWSIDCISFPRLSVKAGGNGSSPASKRLSAICKIRFFSSLTLFCDCSSTAPLSASKD